MTSRILATLAGAVLLAGCNQKPAAPELGIKDFMAQKVEPAAQVYWGSVQYVSDETGEHDIVPQTDADWERTRKAAADLQAFGAELMTPAYADGRGEDWKQFAQGMIDISKKAEKAAVDKSVDQVFEVGGTMYSVCSACHQAYPPAAGEVPADAAASANPG